MIIELEEDKKKAKELEDLIKYLQEKGWKPVIKGTGDGEVAIKLESEGKDDIQDN